MHAFVFTIPAVLHLPAPAFSPMACLHYELSLSISARSLEEAERVLGHALTIACGFNAAVMVSQKR